MKRLLKTLALPAFCLVLALSGCALRQAAGRGGENPQGSQRPYLPPGQGEEPQPSDSPSPIPSPNPSDTSQTVTITKIRFTPTYINTRPIPSGSTTFTFGEAPHVFRFEMGIGGEPGATLEAAFDSGIDPLVIPLGQTAEFELEQSVSFELLQGTTLYVSIALEVRYFDVITGIPRGRVRGSRMDIEARIEGESLRILDIILDEDLSSLASCGIIFDLELGFD